MSSAHEDQFRAAQRKCRQADEPAVNERQRLLEAELPGLRRYARALTGSREDADDLVQDCLERALSRWHLFQADRRLRPWLFTIMHNLFVSARRRAAGRAHLEHREFSQPLVSAPEQGNGLAVAELDRALAMLSPEHRAVLLLVGLEGFSYAEAARILDAPIGTVMSRLSRARSQLREVLAASESHGLRRVR
jgi:RNA polymerase sigma-70 factor (ECF subfamily)